MVHWFLQLDVLERTRLHGLQKRINVSREKEQIGEVSRPEEDISFADGFSSFLYPESNVRTTNSQLFDMPLDNIDGLKEIEDINLESLVEFDEIGIEVLETKEEVGLS